MWVVDDYCDRVVARDEKRIASANKWRANWEQKPLATFDTKESALDFMVERAKQRILKAEKQLAVARKGLKRCERKRTLANSAPNTEELGSVFNPERNRP